MGHCSSTSKDKEHLKEYLKVKIDIQNRKDNIKKYYNKPKFKEKENKLIEYGLLIDNYLFNPVTCIQVKYDRRTIEYKNKVNEYYNIICTQENLKDTKEDRIRRAFNIEYKKK